MLPQQIYKTSVQSLPYMAHSRRLTRTPLPPRHYDWQIDWPADHCCGATWQVEIGKWEARFSLPSVAQRIKAVSSAEAIGRGGAQDAQVVE